MKLKKILVGLTRLEHARFIYHNALYKLRMITDKRLLEVFMELMTNHGADADGSNILTIINPKTEEAYIFTPDLVTEDVENFAYEQEQQREGLRAGIQRESWIV